MNLILPTSALVGLVDKDGGSKGYPTEASPPWEKQTRKSFRTRQREGGITKLRVKRVEDPRTNTPITANFFKSEADPRVELRSTNIALKATDVIDLKCGIAVDTRVALQITSASILQRHHSPLGPLEVAIT
jgi:hypothetical protein